MSWTFDNDYTPCKHGHDPYLCDECIQEARRRKHQKEHEESVRRQRNKIKIAPWRKEND